MVDLADPIEVYEFAVNVIEHLDGRKVLTEEDLCAAAKRFNISLVLWDEGDDLVCDAVLAADVA